MFTDADAAALYDLVNPWDGARYASDAFYDRLVMGAGDVLDVGCGTGAMLRAARAAGHRGRLVGIDPDGAALARARRREDVEWVSGRAADVRWEREFDLATMVSHAFQCLVGDEEVDASLRAVRGALRDGGRFVFETRHPRARAWEGWNPTNVAQVVDPAGRILRTWHEVESVDGDLVTFTGTVAGTDGVVLRVERTTLRFLDVAGLDGFLGRAGFEIEARYGDWDGSPVGQDSREIITVARPG